MFVIVVVIWSRKLRSITNFLLANLAVADLCVGVFCVFQNLYIYFTHRYYFNFFDTIIYLYAYEPLMHFLSMNKCIFLSKLKVKRKIYLIYYYSDINLWLMYRKQKYLHLFFSFFQISPSELFPRFVNQSDEGLYL